MKNTMRPTKKDNKGSPLFDQEFIEYGIALDRAIKEGIDEALERHRKLGEHVIIWQDGKPARVLLNKINPKNQPDESGMFPSIVADYERSLIAKALEECNGVTHDAAKRLGIPKRILLDKMTHYHLTFHDEPPTHRPSKKVGGCPLSGDRKSEKQF